MLRIMMCKCNIIPYNLKINFSKKSTLSPFSQSKSLKRFSSANITKNAFSKSTCQTENLLRWSTMFAPTGYGGPTTRYKLFHYNFYIRFSGRLAWRFNKSLYGIITPN